MFSTGLVFSPVCFLSKKHVLLESTGKWTLTAYGTETRSPIAGCNSETKPGIFYVKKSWTLRPNGLQTAEKTTWKFKLYMFKCIKCRVSIDHCNSRSRLKKKRGSPWSIWFRVENCFCCCGSMSRKTCCYQEPWSLLFLTLMYAKNSIFFEEHPPHRSSSYHLDVHQLADGTCHRPP